MQFSILLVTVLVTCAIQIQGFTRTEEKISNIEKRQATNNADQMVQNIFQWLQGVYAQNSRRIRQGTVREYLPPPNFDKPRPFQPGYPPAGFYPEPPFPFPTNPATGGVTAPEGLQPGDDNLLPPVEGSGGGETGYISPDSHGFTISTEGAFPGESTTSFPATNNGRQQTGGGGEEGPKSFPTHAAGIPTTGQPGFPTEGVPEGGSPGYPTHVAGVSTTGQPGEVSNGGPITTLQPGYPTHAEGLPTTGQPGYPTIAVPEESPSTTFAPGYPTHVAGISTTSQPGEVSEGGPTTTLQPGYPTHAAGVPTIGQPGYATAEVPEGGPSTTILPGYPTHVSGISTTTQSGEVSEGGPTSTLQPGYPTHDGVPTIGQSTEGGPSTGLPLSHEGGSTTKQPSFPTHATEISSSGEPEVVIIHEPTTEQPAGEVQTTPGPAVQIHEGGVLSTAAPGIHEGGITTLEESGVTIHAGVSTTGQPGHPVTTPGIPEGTVESDHAQPSSATEGASQPSHEGSTGYPFVQPESTPGIHILQPGDQTSTSLQPEAGAGSTPASHEQVTQENLDGKNLTPEGEETPSPEGTPSTSEGTATPEGHESLPTEGPGGAIHGEPTFGSSTPQPSGFTTSPAEAPSETEKAGEDTLTVSVESTTTGPEANTIPGKALPEDEDLKHPPHIHDLVVQCSKEMMTINIEFNREFNGVIYSKGFFSTPECRYVQENSGQTKYTFTVKLDTCGTQFVNGFDTENQSYLENVLVIQNEAGVQEVWDTVRSVRCLWGGNIKDSLSVALSVDMLSQEIVTFSGDNAMAKLDVVLGRGPFGEAANGLVKIGEQMTLVVTVSGDPTFDLQVKDCRAVDSENKNTIALTDEDGCILKPKLFGAFQKTKETGDSGASVIAYAYFNAFKFPDQMDLMIECNIEICKNDCDMCTKEDQQLEPSKRRRRRSISNSTIAGDWVTMGKLVRVILPEDLNQHTALEVTTRDHICMTMQGFVFSTAILVSLLVISSFTYVCLWMKRKENSMYLKY